MRSLKAPDTLFLNTIQECASPELLPFPLRCLILELQQGFVAESIDSKYFATDLFLFEQSTDLVVPESLKEGLQILSAMLERVLGIDILIGKLTVIDVVEVVPQVLLV